MTESFTLSYGKGSEIFKYPWYERKFPEPDEIVFAYVNRKDEAGYSIQILNYNEIEAFLPFQELSKKKVYKTILRTGQIKPLQVTNVDNVKGFVDLSNKYVSAAKEDIKDLENYSHLVKIMHQWILKIINKDTNNFMVDIPLDIWKDYMSKTLWLFESNKEAYDAFNDIRMRNKKIEEIFGDLKDVDSLLETIDENIKYEIELVIKLNMYTWSLNPIAKLQTILTLIETELQKEYSDLKLKKLSPPDYEFVLKTSNQSEVTNLQNKVEFLFKELIKGYEDVSYSLTAMVH